MSAAAKDIAGSVGDSLPVRSRSRRRSLKRSVILAAGIAVSLAIITKASIAQAEASLAEARAELQRAALDVGYTRIRSPIDGYVGDRAAQLGAYIVAGSDLLSVIPAHGLWIDANFKENQLAAMAPGQEASIIADAVPGVVFHGRVTSLAPATGAMFSVIPPENATGNFTRIVQRVPVRIALDQIDGTLARLRPGLSVVVSVDTRVSR